MIPIRFDDDEPDIIDLTVSHAYYAIDNFPIRPPTPFADSSVWPPFISENPTDNRTINCSSPIKDSNIGHKHSHNEKNAFLSRSFLSLPRGNGTWRRTLNKFLKRTKSNEHKRATVYGTTPDISKPYDFGSGEINRTDSTMSRNGAKRVHWIDDDEIVLNLCHRFVEYLKLFVQNVMDNTNEEQYLKHCQITLNELNKLIDCQEVRKAFEYIVELAKRGNKAQLIEHQTYIENLLSRTVLLSSA